MKKKAARIVILAGILLLVLYLISQDFFYIAPKEAKSWSNTERAYQWIVAQQRTNRTWFIFHNGLVPSYEGGDYAFTYDQALAAICFTLGKDYERAKLIFDFYNQTLKKQKERYGKFTGFSDAYRRDGRWGRTEAAGPNAWLLLAINYYTYQTEDDTYIPLAREIADWLISLQSIEGGIIGGYDEEGKMMSWISTEHNFDSYAAFRDLGILTSKEKYLKLAKDVKMWLRDCAWDEESERFYMGRDNPNYATDLSSWAVLSLGEEYGPTLDFALDKSLTEKLYKVKDVEVKGFDFGSTYETSPFPDKDAVWFEGTGQMVVAFDVTGRIKERDFFLVQLTKALTQSPSHKYTLGLPYASNEGTPAYGDWLMQDRPLCISSASWYIFGKKGFNPFSMNQKSKQADQIVEDLNYEPDYQFRPIIDNFEYSKVKFETAYPKRLNQSINAKIQRSLSQNEAKEGLSSMEISYQSEKPAPDNWGSVNRPFLYPQDWSRYNFLSFWLKIEDPQVSVRIRLRDREGEPFESNYITINDKDWRKISFNLKDFKRGKAYPHYGNKEIDKDGIREISIDVISQKASYKGTIYIDKIELK